MESSEGATDVSTEECFERKKVELIELIEELAKRLSLDEGPDAATTSIDGRDVGAGSTSRHRDPYIGLLEDELPELIRQYEMLAAQLGSDDGHGAATTTVSGRGLGAGSTAGTPKIVVTAPDHGHGAVANTINGRQFGPGSILRRRGSGAASRFEMVPNDGHGAVAATINGRNPQTRSAFVNHVAQLLQNIDVNVEPDNNNNVTHSNTMLAVYTGVAWSILILGLCFQSGGS